MSADVARANNWITLAAGIAAPIVVFFGAQAQSSKADTDLKQEFQAADSQLDKRVTNLEQLTELKVNRDILELRREVGKVRDGQDEIRTLLKAWEERNNAVDSILIDVRRELRAINSNSR